MGDWEITTRQTVVPHPVKNQGPIDYTKEEGYIAPLEPPPTQDQTIYFHYTHGKRIWEIADLMKITGADVCNTLSRMIGMTVKLPPRDEGSEGLEDLL